MKLKLFLIILYLAFISSCTKPTKFERNPAHIGYGVDDMKMSPCAENDCLVFYKNGEFLNDK